jgi:large repetitive protein
MFPDSGCAYARLSGVGSLLRFRSPVLCLAPLTIVVCVLASAAPALADRAMSTRFSANTNGNITFAANSLMVCQAAASGCTAARNTPAISSGTNNALDNNNYNMQYVNTAPGTVGGVATFDSSSATLSLPSTATVLFAGLYWGADASAGSGGTPAAPAAHAAPGCPAPPLVGNPNCNANVVGLQLPGASGYTTITANTANPADFVVSSSANTRYTAFADVTSMVQAAGPGTYAVGNVQAGTGGDRYAGWTLVVAYADPSQPPRNLTVDDGLITVQSGSPAITIPVSGFTTPPSGPVRTTLGFVAYEGDAGLTGDSATLNTTRLSDPGSPANNFFDSSITNLGTNVTARNPNDSNNFAYDSMLVNANGILGHSVNSANIVVTTSGDTYFPAVVTFATDLFAPNITSTKSVANLTHPGGPDQRGDDLRYTVSYTNTGSDAASNFVMRDAIPAGTTYVPNSLQITAGPQAPASPTDALGDDAAEFNSGTGEVVFRLGAGGNATTGGTIAASGDAGSTVTATFDVTINADAQPGQQILNQANATFTGATLGTSFSDTTPQVVNTVAVPSLTLTKTHAGSLIDGEPTTFTLSVTNVGNMPTDGSTVTVTDPFPADSFSSIQNAGGDGWNCQTSGLTLTCSRSDALAGGNAYPPILVDATVADPAPDTIINTATVSGGGSDPASASDGGGANGLADISITKTADPTTVQSGGTVTFTLNVANSGPSSAQNVTVSDPIDLSSFSDVSVDPSQGTCDATVSCSLGTIVDNGSATITITATVTAGASTLTNNASVASTTPDPDDSDNSASAGINVITSADLAIAKTGDANPDQGATTTYTLTVSNNGPNTADGVVVNDSLPSQFTATAAGGDGFDCTLPGGPGGTVVCTLASLAPTDPATNPPPQITITGTIAAGTAGQSISDSATVTSNTGDPDQTNNTATFNQVIGPVADVAITKQALESDGTTPVTTPLAVADTFIYAITVTNHGPSAAEAVTVTDTLPTGLTLAATATGCTPGSGSGGTISCTLGTLAPGNTVTINLDVRVGATASNTAPTNTATVSSTTVDPDPTDNSASATVGVGQVANLSIAKTADPQTANVGDDVTFTFTVTNSSSVGENDGGPVGLGTTGAVVTDVLPPGIQFVSTASNCTFAAATDTLTCVLGPVAESQIVTASFVGKIVDVAGSTIPGSVIENTGTVASAAAGGFPQLPDLDPSDNNNAASVTVNPQTDLSLTKTASTKTPNVDDEIDYTLTAHNAGPNDATGVTIQDSLPAGLDFLDATPGCNNNAGTVSCDIGALANGDSVSVTIKTRTTAAIAGTAIGNLASVTGDEFDPDTTNNQASTTVDVQPLVDLDLNKVASNLTPTAGGTVTYTLSLVNHGPSAATGVTVTDPLPSGLSFISSTASQGTCGASGQTVTCHLGTLGAGATAVVTVDTRVSSSGVGTTVQNTATATADQPIARPQLLESTASITPRQAPPPNPGPGPSPASADLAVVKTVNHASARVGQPLTYTITVTNHGPDTAATPTVTDTSSPDLKLVSVQGAGASCTHGAPITCKLTSIPSGGHNQITVVARPSKSGQLRNSATVVSPTPDPNMTNNESRVITDVHPGHAALRLKKTPSRRTVRPGQKFSFTIAVRSLGPATATGIKVCDVLGSSMTFVSVHGATFSHGNPCWKISSLAKGKQRSFKVGVRAPMVSGPRRLTNTATVSASGVHKRTVRARVKLVGAPPPAPPPAVTG